MYSKPTLERFGSMRDLTEVGLWTAGSDVLTSVSSIFGRTPDHMRRRPRSS